MSYELFSNFALEGFVLAVWLLAKQLLARSHRAFRELVLGLLIGAGTVAVMATALNVEAGILFDLRFALIAAVTLLEGPVAGLIVALVATLFRWMVGGFGAFPGTVAIFTTLAIALLGYHLAPKTRSVGKRIAHIYAFAIASAVLPFLAILLLPDKARAQIEWVVLGSDIALNALAILMFWYVVKFFDAKSRENALLLEALAQSPDYLYVKNERSRFVAANKMVLDHHGLASSAAIRGKTDFDLVKNRQRARLLFEEEQRLVAGTSTALHKQEILAFDGGEQRTFDTNKTVVADIDGKTIGIVGITRDITEQSRAHQALEESEKKLSLVLSTMTDGVAMFDEDGRLVFCNEQYHRFFPLTRDVRVPGASLKSILYAAADRGEQLDIPTNDVAGWSARILSSLKTGGKHEVRLYDGRTIEVRTQVVVGKGAVSAVSDITQIREAEQKLATLASQLQVLATTDPLTAVMNRRAFDEQLQREFAAALTHGIPLSLLIIDVDQFKAFNDHYGHPEGDECLKRVASSLAATIENARHSVARYGGEEFCVLLPQIGPEEARDIAEEMRRAVEARAIPHAASQLGQVTISVGVETFDTRSSFKVPLALKEHADKALYRAKSQGRNRVCIYKSKASVALRAVI